MSDAVTNLVQFSDWMLGAFAWSHGGAGGFVDNTGAAKDLVAIYWDEGLSAYRCRVSQNNGASWNKVTITSLSGIGDNRIACQLQDASGVVHAFFEDVTVGYARFSLTRDGSGHVTGVTQNAQMVLPSLAADGNWNWKPYGFLVTDGVGTTKICCATMVSANTDAINRLGHIEVTWAPLNVSATSGWLNAAGTTSSYDTIYTGSALSDLDSHVAIVLGAQLPSQGEINLFFGLDSGNETLNIQGNGKGSLRRARISTSGANWSVGTVSSLMSSTASLGPGPCCVGVSSRGIHLLYRNTGPQLVFGLVDTSNGWTAIDVSVASMYPGYSDPLCVGQFACNADGTQFWCVYVRTAVTGGGGGVDVTYGHYVASSWINTTDTNTTYSTNLVLPGVSQITGISNGLYFLANMQSDNPQVGTFFGSIIYTGFIANVSESWSWSDSAASTAAFVSTIVESLRLTEGVTALQSSTTNPGFAEVDFGPAPGKNQASLNIVGQSSIQSTSHCEAFWMAEAWDAHSLNDHAWVARFAKLTCGTPVNGVGFTVTATSTQRLTGKFKFRWLWNN